MPGTVLNAGGLMMNKTDLFSTLTKLIICKECNSHVIKIEKLATIKKEFRCLSIHSRSSMTGLEIQERVRRNQWLTREWQDDPDGGELGGECTSSRENSPYKARVRTRVDS